MSCDTDAQYERALRERALSFAESKRYAIEFRKRAIPDFIIDSLSRYNSERFSIGDSLDASSIDLSDFRLQEGWTYNRQLSFILEGKSEYLMVYKEGGIGVHDVVDYFVLDGVWSHWRCTTAEEIVDVQSLNEVLRNAHN